MRFMFLLLVMLVGGVGQAAAHEIRPAYLEIRETAPGELDVRFRQPVIDAGDGRLGGLNLAPVFPTDCTLVATLPVASTDDDLTQRYSLSCPQDLQPLTVVVEGLERTLTDVYVTHVQGDGTRLNHLLNAVKTGLTLGEASKLPLLGYFRVGVDHLLGGLDHVLFVIGLILLVPNALRLVTVATTFTIAHSLTLALSVLDVVKLPSAPVEAGIALSVLYLAYELTRPVQSESSVARRRPELIALGFGLLHGFGFAGALAETGMPPGQLAPALFMFNVGVESGQLMIIALVVAAQAALRQVGDGLGRQSRLVLSSVLTIGAAYFFAGAFATLAA